MRMNTGWSYAPYIPADEDPDGLRVVCLRPGLHTAQIEWTGTAAGDHVRIFYGKDALTESLETQDSPALLTGLEQDTDWIFQIVAADERRSAPSRFRTGKAPGVVVNYLHPGDTRCAFSGRYLCSPSIVALPSGALLTSMDVYGPNMPQNLTILCRSEDGGQSWRYAGELMPCFWGELFLHEGKLYCLGASTEYGDLLLGCSEDAGASWSAPTTLLRGAGRVDRKGCHKAPVPVLHASGRLWTAVEYGSWQAGGFASALFSLPEAADPMDASAWRRTPFTPVSAQWPGIDPSFRGMIEGNAVEGPDGFIWNILRYKEGQAVVLRTDPQKPESEQTFCGLLPLPFAHTKFEIRRREDGEYFAAGNEAPARTVLSVYRSKDLVCWEKVADAINRRGDGEAEVGFQYPAFQFDENGDMLLLSRTAWNGAHSFHDSNYQTFHKISLPK